MGLFSTFGGRARSSRARVDSAIYSTHHRYVFLLVPTEPWRLIVTQAAAKASLELHGRELEPTLPLTVYISNPERKKERTDADAADKEIYVAGLSKFTKEGDLQRLFKTVRVGLISCCHSH